MESGIPGHVEALDMAKKLRLLPRQGLQWDHGEE
jgi:hypothetical protein